MKRKYSKAEQSIKDLQDDWYSHDCFERYCLAVGWGIIIFLICVALFSSLAIPIFIICCSVAYIILGGIEFDDIDGKGKE